MRLKSDSKRDILLKILEVVKSKEFGREQSRFQGICSILNTYPISIATSKGQRDYIRYILPKLMEDGYCWKRGAKKPRIGWIEKQIKKLEGE